MAAQTGTGRARGGPVTRHAQVPRRRTVRAVVRIDLAPHVLAGGELGAPAEAIAWSILGTVAPGQCVDIHIGAARYLSERLLYILCEGLLGAAAGAVQLSGQDGAAVAKVAALIDERAAQ